MADKIKKFFSRTKIQGKNMGQGRKLNADSASTPTSSGEKKSQNKYIPPPRRNDLSDEAKSAAAAALARVEQKKGSGSFNTSLAAIRAQAKRELEEEHKAKEQLSNLKEVKEDTIKPSSSNMACQGVFFRCPIISEAILSKNEWKIQIKEFLYQQLEIERGLTACLIICNCNPKEKAEACIETLSKYLENLINHPDEEKYYKIRMNNRIFSEKVNHVEGALEFLKAAGFEEQEIDNEPFLLWNKDNVVDGQDLSSLLEGLRNADIIHLELDRNIQILLPSQARRTELPSDFFRISPEEMKREQMLKTKALEEAQILKTKAMREREEQRILNMYRYALIRVKFPDAIYIQGTFNVYEKLVDIFQFVQSCLADESLDFNLSSAYRKLVKFSDDDMDKSLYDLRLFPNEVLLFIPEIKQPTDNYIKEELLLLIKSI